MTKQQEQDFERKKNTKALGYTLGISGLLLLLFFFASWKTPEPELPIKEDLVEIDLGELNLGNTDNGKGDVQPLIRGDFAAVKQETAPVKSNPAPAEDAADPLTDDNNNDDAPEVVKQTQKPVKPSNHIADRQVTTTRNNNPPTNNPPAEPVRTPPRPRAQMTAPGRNGPGGNNTDGYNNSRSQGDGTRTGDQGDPNGSPNGTGTGPRKLTDNNMINKGEISRLANQSGTNYRGRITLNLSVDENGTVTNVNNVSASPVSDGAAEAKSFARSLAYKIKYKPGGDGRTATTYINFNMND
jgi:outer membrane biosynthesis protein TonB